MKKRILQCLSLILCAAMLAIPAAAAETADEEAPARLGPAAYWGTVTWMDEDTFLLDSGKEDGLGAAVVVHVGDAPYLDAVTGNTLNLETLEDGDAVYAWVGPAMALSLPPQSTASLIVGNIPADYAVPQYYEITSSTVTEESAVLHVAGSNDTITVPASAKLTPYLTKNIVTLADLRPGARILVWSDSKGTPEKVLVFAYGYRGYISVAEDGVVLPMPISPAATMSSPLAFSSRSMSMPTCRHSRACSRVMAGPLLKSLAPCMTFLLTRPGRAPKS